MSYSKLTITCNTIATKSESDVFGGQLLKGSFQFSVKIEKMKSTMKIGIADSNYRKTANLGSLPLMIEYQSNGYCWDGRSFLFDQGKGYKQG